MDEPKPVEPHICLRSVYEFVTATYTNSDHFSDISRELTSPQSGLRRALSDLERAPEGEIDIWDRKPPLKYRHSKSNYSISICAKDVLFALQHVFYDSASVDVVAYMGSEGYLNRAMFIHRGDFVGKVENDSLQVPKEPERYVHDFLAAAAEKDRTILQTGCEYIQEKDDDKKEDKKVTLEKMLASVKLSA